MKDLALAVALALAGIGPAAATDLPAICTGGTGQSAPSGHADHSGMAEMGGMGAMGQTGGMAMDDEATGAHGSAMAMGPDQDAAHRELMAGMDEMNRLMMEGGAVPDIDIAFACAMIPHHQGAVDMAKAELAHGDDPWARAFAQKIIDSQEKEIAEMRAWLDKLPH